MKITDHYEHVKYNLCQGEDFAIRTKPRVRDFDPDKVFSASHGIMGTQQIVRCRRCGLMFVNPRIKSERVVNAYQDSEDELYVSQAEARIKTFQNSLRLVERYAPQRGKILDVGAAAGFFLKTAKDAGWETYGVEPSRWLAQWGNERYQVNIRPGVLRSAKFKPGFFEAVTMWDVLEHVPDPLSELLETNRILKNGGLLVINYPNIGSKMARLAGSRWWFLLSVHLFYFTQDTLRRYLERAGFKVIQSSRYWQKLELEHLIKMVGLYSRPLSKLGLKIAAALRMNRWKIPYYASQANVVAIKVKDVAA